ncbi:MAG TPA: MFS transporter [Candidatus Binatia bacterium]|nr:MFS transporter [Candidatus Binatia bacterium]
MLGLVWLGDALIYVVMPLHAQAFGISLGLVGVALSLNRIVRILGYGWVTHLSRRLGMRALTAWAALGAALSTLGYGALVGLLPLLAARLVWGLAYGVLNVTTTAYAIGDGGRPGRRVGLNRAVSTVGPALALSVGAWLAVTLGPRTVFVVLGGVGLLAVPLALTLPREIPGHAAAGRAGTRWRPSTLNLLFFMLSAIEGAFATTLSLLFAGSTSVTSAVLAAGLVLALQRVTIVLLSLLAGPAIDRVGARNLMVPCVAVIVAGLLGIAHGVVWGSAIVVVIARAVLGTAGPVLATQEREGSVVERLAAFATWVDSGLAVGPLVGGFVVARFGMPALYDALAIGIVVALAIHLTWGPRHGPQAP